MKKLYNCNAEYDVYNLKSYNTMIIKRDGDLVYYNNYRSHTTLLHIRRYIDKLCELNHFNDYPSLNFISIVCRLYKVARENKLVSGFTYNYKTDKISEMSYSACREVFFK